MLYNNYNYACMHGGIAQKKQCIRQKGALVGHAREVKEKHKEKSVKRKKI